jgi:hypothetical protein
VWGRGGRGGGNGFSGWLRGLSAAAPVTPPEQVGVGWEELFSKDEAKRKRTRVARSMGRSVRGG